MLANGSAVPPARRHSRAKHPVKLDGRPNPYERLPAAAFDDFVDDISTRIRRALDFEIPLAERRPKPSLPRPAKLDWPSLATLEAQDGDADTPTHEDATSIHGHDSEVEQDEHASYEEAEEPELDPFSESAEVDLFLDEAGETEEGSRAATSEQASPRSLEETAVVLEHSEPQDDESKRDSTSERESGLEASLDDGSTEASAESEELDYTAVARRALAGGATEQDAIDLGSSSADSASDDDDEAEDEDEEEEPDEDEEDDEDRDEGDQEEVDDDEDVVTDDETPEPLPVIAQRTLAHPTYDIEIDPSLLDPSLVDTDVTDTTLPHLIEHDPIEQEQTMLPSPPVSDREEEDDDAMIHLAVAPREEVEPLTPLSEQDDPVAQHDALTDHINAYTTLQQGSPPPEHRDDLAEDDEAGDAESEEAADVADFEDAVSPASSASVPLVGPSSYTLDHYQRDRRRRAAYRQAMLQRRRRAVSEASEEQGSQENHSDANEDEDDDMYQYIQDEPTQASDTDERAEVAAAAATVQAITQPSSTLQQPSPRSASPPAIRRIDEGNDDYDEETSSEAMQEPSVEDDNDLFDPDEPSYNERPLQAAMSKHMKEEVTPFSRIRSGLDEEAENLLGDSDDEQGRRRRATFAKASQTPSSPSLSPVEDRSQTSKPLRPVNEAIDTTEEIEEEGEDAMTSLAGRVKANAEEMPVHVLAETKSSAIADEATLQDTMSATDDSRAYQSANADSIETGGELAPEEAPESAPMPESTAAEARIDFKSHLSSAFGIDPTAAEQPPTTADPKDHSNHLQDEPVPTRTETDVLPVVDARLYTFAPETRATTIERGNTPVADVGQASQESPAFANDKSSVEAVKAHGLAADTSIDAQQADRMKADEDVKLPTDSVQVDEVGPQMGAPETMGSDQPPDVSKEVQGMDDSTDSANALVDANTDSSADVESHTADAPALAVDFAQPHAVKSEDNKPTSADSSQTGKSSSATSLETREMADESDAPDEAEAVPENMQLAPKQLTAEEVDQQSPAALPLFDQVVRSAHRHRIGLPSIKRVFGFLKPFKQAEASDPDDRSAREVHFPTVNGEADADIIVEEIPIDLHAAPAPVQEQKPEIEPDTPVSVGSPERRSARLRSRSEDSVLSAAETREDLPDEPVRRSSRPRKPTKFLEDAVDPLTAVSRQPSRQESTPIRDSTPRRSVTPRRSATPKRSPSIQRIQSREPSVLESPSMRRRHQHGNVSAASFHGAPTTSTHMTRSRCPYHRLGHMDEYGSHYIFLVPFCSIAGKDLTEDDMEDLGEVDDDSYGQPIALPDYPHDLSEPTEHVSIPAILEPDVLMALIRVVGLDLVREGQCELVSAPVPLAVSIEATRDVEEEEDVKPDIPTGDELGIGQKTAEEPAIYTRTRPRFASVKRKRSLQQLTTSQSETRPAKRNKPVSGWRRLLS
ncbi:uncharacterized protein L969DRAFT_19083 [Mixia osmundae IAM 14324]|nr:uncharacterized protein L969DRAFT_19083 [Mixia osmundae IAM 14324]KEI37604.1 hypothetical protein L969DRAFT_19083 [Mixia osmundae IAM 14324]